MNNETMELLEKHFDIAFAAPDGIKKLRELILTLAMQGKLVPQDLNDQPASELLKEIEAEKKRLVKEGKMKQPKLLPEIKLEEVPYELPEGWEWVRLGAVSIYIQRGQGPSYSDIPEIPVISQKCIQWSGFNKNVVRFIDPCTIDKYRDERLIRSGDLLWNSTGTGTIGRINLYRDELNEFKKVVADSHVTVVRLTGLCNEYVLNFLMNPSVQGRIEENASGTTNQIELNTSTVINQIFPLPPLAEQHRIVAKIDQLMARCDELKKLRAEREQKRITVHTAALNRLLMAKESSNFSTAWRFITQHFGELYSVKENVTELRKAILQLAVMGKLVPQDPKDEPVENLLARILVERKQLKLGSLNESQPPNPLGYDIPEHWKWQCLNSILVSGPTNGFSPKAVDYETPVRSLTLSATTSGKFKGEYSKFISNDIPSDSNLWLCDGDILVQRGNTLEYVGAPAVYRGEPNRFIYPDLMMKLRVSSEIDTNFIYLVMSSEPCRDFLRSHASGTSGTMPKINQTTLKSLPIPIPPLAEQRRIVVKIDRLMTLCDVLKQRIDDANGKRAALLNALTAQV
ncbi:MAG TPA: restriction endonuclease subunit S [Methylococcales bacterium]